MSSGFVMWFLGTKTSLSSDDPLDIFWDMLSTSSAQVVDIIWAVDQSWSTTAGSFKITLYDLMLSVPFIESYQK